MNITELLNMDSFTLIEHLYMEYVVELPEALITVEDMQEAGSLLPKLINAYSFLASASEYAKVLVRENKGKIPKDELNELMGKRDAIIQAAETAKMQYTALSRMITVKQEINNELRMSEIR